MDKQHILRLIEDIKYEVNDSQNLFLLEEWTTSSLIHENFLQRLRGISRHGEYRLKEQTLAALSFYKSPFFQKAIRLGLPEKEICEVEEFNLRVRSINDKSYTKVYDFCSGNGLNMYYWDLQGISVTAYDIITSRNFSKVKPFLRKSNLELRNIFKDEFLLEPCSLVLAIHACGELTDRVLELAIRSENDFAIMPCCETKSMGDISSINYRRVNHIFNHGYSTFTAEISKKITTKNNLIIGKKNNY